MPTEPPREPDRFEAKARELYETADLLTKNRAVDAIAAALRQAADEALERAAQVVEEYGSPIANVRVVAQRIRALKQSAALPATGTETAESITCTAEQAVSLMAEGVALPAPPSEPVAPAPDRLRWEAVDMSGASASAACYEIHDDRGDIVALCFQQEDAEHIATLHNTAIFGAASPVVQGKETRK